MSEETAKSGRGMRDAGREGVESALSNALPLSQCWERGLGGESVPPAAPGPHPAALHATTDPQDELFDIYDEHGQRTGRSKARQLVHRDGDWHLALHIWVGGLDAAGQPFALFQRRSMTKDTWPGALDVAVGGHVRAGETLEETLREADEEIGLQVALADLVYIGRRYTATRHSGYIDREIEEVYALRSDLALSAYRLHPEEVDSVVAVGIGDVRRLFTGTATTAAAYECRRDGTTTRQSFTITDFVKVEGSYIEDALSALERVVTGLPVTPFTMRVSAGDS